MPSWLNQTGALYSYTLVISFCLIAVWETYCPRSELRTRTGLRWWNHTLLAVLYISLARLIMPATAIFTAVAAQDSPYGLLNRAAVPFWLRVVIAILILDLLRYTQHRVYHSVGALWNFHQVHHSDPDYDLTTGLRFHPVEALVTQGSYLLVLIVLAPPPLAVFLGELASQAQNFFSHANAVLPARLERGLRRILVTPDLHRVHHSDDVQDQNKNLGNIFPWWDRLFGTYQDAPRAGMSIGLHGYQSESSNYLRFMLALPFERFPLIRRSQR